jgi:hypothetical protein
MRLLPREHGATVIWFCSLLLTFGTLQAPPSPVSGVGFLAASTLALVLIARLTSGSKAIARLEHSPTLLPVLSGLLTLIVPLGQIVMVGRFSTSGLAAWLVFLTYGCSGAIYTRDLVRSILSETPPKWTSFNFSAALLAAEIVTLSMINWFSIAAMAVIVPLTVHRIVVPSLIQRKSSSRIARIRLLGLAQTGNLIAAVAIVVLASKL